MNFIEFQSAVKENFYPIVVLHGEDAFLRRRALQTLTKTIDLQAEEFNYVYFDEPVGFSELFDACELMPFGSEKRMVVCNGFNVAAGDDLKTRLVNYAKNPNMTTCLVFILVKQHNLFITERVTCVNCDRLELPLVVKWISATVKNAGKTIKSGDAAMLAEYCLRDMSRVSQEVNKLLSAVEGVMIEVKDIERHVSKDIEFVVFDLSNAIAARDNRTSLVLLNKILTSGEDKRKLVGLIYSNFRRIFFAAVNSSESINDLAYQLGVKEYAVQIARKLSAKYTKMQLKHILDMIVESERQLKVDFINENECLQTLVLLILSTGGKRAR